MPTPCFWVEPTDDCHIFLRRYTMGNYVEGHEHHRADKPANHVCPSQAEYNSYLPGHRASSEMIDTRPIVRTDEGYISSLRIDEFEGHPSWPTTCESCGQPMPDDATSMVEQRPIYRRPDTGERWTDKDLPPGAMFDSFWFPYKGADGLALTVVLPPQRKDMRGHWWHPDGPARSGGTWTRTGDPRNPPTLSITPSIASPDYHGYLTNGVLTDDLDAATRGQ